MIPKKISEKILTVGCAFQDPKGGIAQLLHNYQSFIFVDMKYVENSDSGTVIHKLEVFVKGIIRFFYILLFDRKIKIVHIHTASRTDFRRSILYARFAFLFRKRVVLTVHGGMFKEYASKHQDYIARWLRRCDSIIALSDSWKFYFETQLKCSNVEVVPNVVMDPQISGDIQNMRSEKPLTFLFLGALVEQKGIYDLLEVMSSSSNEWRGKIHLIIAGRGEDERVRSFIYNHSLKNMVNFVGWADEASKRNLLRISSVFILPSYIEGLPISILEAMTYRMPIISTNVGGIPEVVNATNGILFRPGDKKGLKEAIDVLCNDSDLRKCLGRRSWEKVQPYLPSAVESKLMEVYGNLLED